MRQKIMVEVNEESFHVIAKQRLLRIGQHILT